MFVFVKASKVVFIHYFLIAPEDVQLLGNLTAVQGENITFNCTYSASIPPGSGTKLFIKNIKNQTSEVDLFLVHA